MISDDQIEQLKVHFGRVGVVRFDGHLFVFQQPNAEHGRFFRRGVASNNVDVTDELAAQLICAFDGLMAPENDKREPVRVAFRAWLSTRPLAMDNQFFSPVFAELLGQAEEGNAERGGKGCAVLSNTRKTSP